MEIAGVPQTIDHDAWISFLASVGFDTRGAVRSIATVDSYTITGGQVGLRVTLANGDVVTVPFVRGGAR